MTRANEHLTLQLRQKEDAMKSQARILAEFETQIKSKAEMETARAAGDGAPSVADLTATISSLE